MSSKKPRTIGELKSSGYKIESVRDEMRRNLIAKLKKGEKLFPGVVGYDETVIPSLANAILSRHDFILLGLRGQAKTRILRGLVDFLDDEIPFVSGSEINDNPLAPVSRFASDLIEEHGDNTEIDWLPRENRYGEKLATPDVTIADLIGDLDPIKAATQKLHYSHEGIIHFGIIPRTNRGIFAINELPDLQPRIQVGLLNILEEEDIQIRGFPVRIPLDVLLVFSANPEDYTNRGNIITPLKDRIGSQILTHYPKSIEHGMAITEQEAWVERQDGIGVNVPSYMLRIVEQVAIEARTSEYVDQKSGVSARMAIGMLENLVSNVERRAMQNGSRSKAEPPRMCDLQAAISSITGKIELVYEGEQEGPFNIARALIGRAIKKLFLEHFPSADLRSEATESDDTYAELTGWFDKGNAVHISDTMSFAEYQKSLSSIPGLQAVVEKHWKEKTDPDEIFLLMEFVLEALHQHSRISKDMVEGTATYRDLMSSIFDS